MASTNDASYSITLPLVPGRLTGLKSVFQLVADICKLAQLQFILATDNSTVVVKATGDVESVESFRDMTEFVSERFI